MRSSGRPPASFDADGRRQPADPRRGAAAGEVRTSRTPDRVLRERRAARDETLDGSVAVDPSLLAGLEQALQAPRIEFIVEGLAPAPSAVPSWLRPFAIGPNARFTRTPDSILRGPTQSANAPSDAATIDPEAAADAIAAMAFTDVGAPPARPLQPARLRRLAEVIRLDDDAPETPGEQDNERPSAAVDETAPEPAAEAPAAFITGSLGSPFGSFAPVSYSASFAWAPVAPAAPEPAPIAPPPAPIPAAVPAVAPAAQVATPAPAAPPVVEAPPAPVRAKAPVPAPQAAVAPIAPIASAPAPRRAPAPSPASDVYELPPLELLAEAAASEPCFEHSEEFLNKNSLKLQQTLQDFGVRGEIIDANPGPVVTLYEFEPAPGVKSSRVIALASDIARSMSAVSARVAVVEGRNVIGIELPNAKRETVYLRELLETPEFGETKQKLAMCLGKTIGGEPVIADLAKMPHLLVAGTTGSGKSVAINTMILSLLYMHPPEKCRLIMVDPKMLELSVYEGIPHLLTPVVTDPKKAVIALKWAVREMEDRYRKMSKLGVRNIDGFNARAAEATAKGETVVRTVQTGFDRETGQPTYEDEVMDLTQLPYIVVIVDEMADLMMVAGKEIEGAIQRLAQMARAAGIHIVMATQRPSVDVITGTIKANFPTRISFQVTSKIDSRTILGEMGAEQLLGQGDMLHMAGGGRILRVHGPFVSDAEVEKVVDHLKLQGRPEYLEAVTADDEEEAGAEDGEGLSEDVAVFDAGEFGEEGGDAYDQAVAVVLRDRKASTSYIQRRLQIGYNRAASIMERMENEGIVGPANHAGKREIFRGQ
ncbi:S-DNA-T family DNA segregation ATPase FtsK/SpoIIIE [Methylopila capsulata]|uniref:S-DNA-T family DNA segregation ATPase FtsK/SpoIIIE n=1 Tax=Methylopila capsulata TaxID=61654 RepID=A0A9W6IT37_9HYPH|nr:DNA translocase FtsK [Methylopila capsulata]MBM7851548.1 S-DNA-T family DNA segregation ATPase FtsK/SpoIIIE [Methylopila capsulata]GLK54606.1 hypothetical protein GCM10008170_06250 [Methylopila capsulata]